LNRKLAWSLCWLVLALCSTPAMAQTLYSNLGTGTGVYYCCEGWTISGTGTIGFTQTVAEEFQVSSIGYLGQIDAGVGYVEGANAFTISLDADNNGTPGAVLGSWTNLQSPQSFGGCCGLITITGISGITLNPGSNYWLVVAPVTSDSTLWGAWNFSNSATGNLAISTDGGQSWTNYGVTNQGAFDIIGEGCGVGNNSPDCGPPVAEPSSILLFGSGILGLVGAMRRKLF